MSAVPYEELNLGGAVGDDPDSVRANRELAAKSLGLDPDLVVWMNQVHGPDVAVVDGPWGDRPVPKVDAVVTRRRGLALAVLTADCTPVLLADPVAGVVAGAHAGRPGMVAGVVPAAVAAMVELGAEPARIVARTGPAVCGRCYEVPDTMRAEVAAVEPAAYAETSWGTPAVDVTAGCTRNWSGSGCATGSSRRSARWSPMITSRTAGTEPRGGSRAMCGWTDGA